MNIKVNSVEVKLENIMEYCEELTKGMENNHSILLTINELTEDEASYIIDKSTKSHKFKKSVDFFTEKRFVYFGFECVENEKLSNSAKNKINKMIKILSEM